MSNGKVAPIWCQVSSHDQRELSLDFQEAAIRRVLEAQGYDVPPQYVLKRGWTSFDLMACPPFQQLRRWVVAREIAAVSVLDRDRPQAQDLRRKPPSRESANLGSH